MRTTRPWAPTRKRGTSRGRPAVLPPGAPRGPADGLPGLGHTKKEPGIDADGVWRPKVGVACAAAGPGIDLRALKVDVRLTSA